MLVVGYITNIFASFSIIDHRTAWNINVDIFSIGAMALVSSTISAMFRIDVALVFQMKQRPIIVIAPQIDAASITSIPAIWPTIGLIFHVTEVHRASSALARATINLDVVDEIGVSHAMLYRLILFGKLVYLAGNACENLFDCA